MATLKDYEFEVMECLRCKSCLTSPPPELFEICPSYKRFKYFAYSGGGQVGIAKAIGLGTLDWSTDVADVMYRCTMCGACREMCLGNFGRIQNPEEYKWTNLIELFQLMRAELIEQAFIPPEVRDFLEHTMVQGNPLGESRAKRGRWLEGTGIKTYEPGDDYLFYVGSLGSYDARCQKVAVDLGKILMASGLSFGVLGSEENSDGNEVKMLGEEGLFEHLARENIEKFEKLDIDKVITLSPHAYNAMKNEYPKLGGSFQVQHYTEVLWGLVEGGRLRLKELRAKVTYHDPCFLGRYNQIYDEPRQLLNAIPGIEIAEMGRNREKSYCCGGGSGNYCMDLLGGGEASPNRIRVREAYDTGADVVAVSCPGCLTMLEDALKTEGLEKKISVRDISEITV